MYIRFSTKGGRRAHHSIESRQFRINLCDAQVRLRVKRTLVADVCAITVGYVMIAEIPAPSYLLMICDPPMRLLLVDNVFLPMHIGV